MPKVRWANERIGEYSQIALNPVQRERKFADSRIQRAHQDTSAGLSLSKSKSNSNLFQVTYPLPSFFPFICPFHPLQFPIAMMNHSSPLRLHRDSKQRALAYFNRAAHYYRQARYAQAVQHYLAGLKFNPMCVEVHADLAKAYEMLGCWNQALECLNTALQLRPGYPIALRRQKRILEEREIYETLIADPNLDLERFASPLPSQQKEDRKGVDEPIPRNLDCPRSPYPSPQAWGEGGGVRGDARHVATGIERDFFTLTCTDAIPQHILSTVCQQIERTYHEVGKILQCYPQHKVTISIEDGCRNDAPSDFASGASLPVWAAASYDGRIRLICRSYSNSGLAILATLIRHEWVHLLVDLLTHGQCPAWIDEGLAQFIARPLMNSERERLREANRERQLLKLRTLTKPFRQIAATQRRLAYLQACAIAEYLVQQFGFASICVLLKRIGDGTPVKIVIREVFGQTADGIVATWRMTIDEVESWENSIL